VLKRSDDAESDRMMRVILAEGTTGAGRAWTRRIELDKRKQVEALGSRPADPNPLPWTRYKTEAGALIGCATPLRGGALLFALVRAVRPLHAIEIGTAHGYGALYIGAGLQENGRGTLCSLEGMRVRVDLGRQAIRRFGLEEYVSVVEGDFRTTVPETLARMRPVDLIFSDGNKDPSMTRDQFWMGLAAMEQGGYMLFDDIGFSAEISALWREFVENERVRWATAVQRRWGLLRIAPTGPEWRPRP
jgi:predicted O-methyltransferase YrrM